MLLDTMLVILDFLIVLLSSTARALQTLVEDELEESNELSLIDLHPQTENAFSRLLSSNEDMMVNSLNF